MRARNATRRRAPAGLAAWVGLLVVAIALLTTWSDPRVATPALGDLSAWSAWAAGNDPVLVAVAVLRLVLVGLTWYLLGATAIQVVARLTDNAGLLRFANALSIPLVRQVVSTGLGVSLAATMVTAATGGARPLEPGAIRSVASASEPGDHEAVDSPLLRTSTRVETGLQQSPASAAEPERGMAHVPLESDLAASAGMQRVGVVGGKPTAPMLHTPLAAATAVGAVRGQAKRDATTAPATWTVRPGDHLWSIAEAVLARVHGDVPDEESIAPYWLELIEANRDRLPDPGNPDLLYAGIELDLPSVPGAGDPGGHTGGARAGNGADVGPGMAHQADGL